MGALSRARSIRLLKMRLLRMGEREVLGKREREMRGRVMRFSGVMEAWELAVELGGSPRVCSSGSRADVLRRS